MRSLQQRCVPDADLQLLHATAHIFRSLPSYPPQAASTASVLTCTTIISRRQEVCDNGWHITRAHN